jgi:hypothetical protein
MSTTICVGCHNGHISKDCPVHGKDKDLKDARCREYTAAARRIHDIDNPSPQEQRLTNAVTTSLQTVNAI